MGGLLFLEQLFGTFAEKLGRRMSGQLTKGRVDVDYETGGIKADYADRGLVENSTEALFALGQSRFRQMAVSDVQKSDDRSPSTGSDRRYKHEEAHATIAVRDVILEAERGAVTSQDGS
jgi:hypothetical protein